MSGNMGGHFTGRVAFVTGAASGRCLGTRTSEHGSPDRRAVWLPVFLLAGYAKNEKANLSKAERNAMANVVPEIIQGYARVVEQNDEDEEAVLANP